MSSSLKLIGPILVLTILGCNDSNKHQLNKTDSTRLTAQTIASTSDLPSRFNIGETAAQELIAGWDIDIDIDGKGLPIGSGTVAQGELLYDNLCAACHGTFGEGEQQWPKLTGGESSLVEQRPLKTVGSFWPYSTTLWDYINRAMPFPAPQSLEVNEVYAITAYVLNLNEIIDSDFVLNNQNLASIKMPNSHGFKQDPRPDTNNQRCMKDCRSKSIKLISGPVYKASSQQTLANTDKGSSTGELIYTSGCNLCHDRGLMQAPRIGFSEDWEKRLANGVDSVYDGALKGKGSMPAKGGRNDLSNNSIKLAVDYMLESLE